MKGSVMAAKIAVVDDSKIALEWAKEKLTPLGFEVVTYNKPMGVSAFVRVSKPDLLLLDVNMEKMQGDMVCKLLKADPGTKDTVIALYSSIPRAELEELAKSVGADAAIPKTENPQQLATAIAQHLKL